MWFTATVASVWLAAADANQAAVVVLGTSTSVEAVVRQEESLRAAGYSVVGQRELAERLTGTAGFRTPDIEALAAMLKEARDNEARFDTASARGLRQAIVAAYDETLRPSAELRQLAAAALHDQSAAALAEGDATAAAELARTAIRRFPDCTLDSKRHGPAIRQLFRAAEAAVAESPSYQLVVHADRPGELYADGRHLGKIESRLTATLPAGQYRVWLIHAGGMSLPYPADLSLADAELHIESLLDTEILAGPIVSLTCKASECPRALDRICARAGATRCELAQGSVDAATAGFSAKSLIPFGGGQLAQGRALLGWGLLAGEGVLLGWNGLATYRHLHAQEAERGDVEAWRRQRNVSAVLFWGTLAAGVIEAVVHGLVTPPLRAQEAPVPAASPHTESP